LIDSRTSPTVALGRGDALLEEGSVDTQPLGQPGDRLAGRARLPALDLAHVLLREAFAGELRLRHAVVDAKLAHALAERRRAACNGRTRLYEDVVGHAALR
jgi:hypothetical protein